MPATKRSGAILGIEANEHVPALAEFRFGA
jgi:hypothetical protein